MTQSARLWPWSLFAALIAAAGLPIYIHAPKLYVDNYGVSLAALGGVLALLRLVDVVQDPLLGWLSEAVRAQRGLWVAAAALLMAGAMLCLLAVPPPVAPLLWFAACLTVLFTAFSFLTIVFYAQGVAMAASLGEGGHITLAGWRETGSLAGVSLAATAPVALATISDHPFAGFAAGFALLALVAVLAMRHNWRKTASTTDGATGFALFRPALADPLARGLLLLALVNAAPVAVTSTLFLFFVESRLGLAPWAGAFLLLFFLSAAATAAGWSRLGSRYGEKRVLATGMGLSIASFLWALMLGAGDGIAFALVSVASGAALAADMVLLPALFARRLEYLGSASAGFGLWSFVSKLSLALAAATLLPALQLAGFASGEANSPAALTFLTLLYAGLPCALKALALMLLLMLPIEKV